MIQTAPYGQWDSPLTAERLATCSISLNEVVVDEASGAIYSVQCRPTEDGRFAIVQHLNGQSRDVLPREMSAHATVQELGGGSVAMRPDGHIIFADDKSRGVYTLDPASGQTKTVCLGNPDIRYADFCSHPTSPQWVIAIKEDHREATPETQSTHVHNSLVAINVYSGEEKAIAQGDDFYSHPKFNNDGSVVSWIQWSHPDMPWTGTRLCFAEWKDGSCENPTHIAGKALEESIAQPKWGLDGLLYFASDRTGYWQLYSFCPQAHQIRALTITGAEKSEFAGAEWLLGSSTYIHLTETTIVATAVTEATSRLMLIDTTTCTGRELDLPYVDIGSPETGIYRVSSNSFAIVASSATSPQELALVTIAPSLETEKAILMATASFDLAPGFVSRAISYTAPQVCGPQADGVVHMFYFPPRNPNFQAPGKTLPPLLVKVHGGPNGHTSPALDLEIQYWTTRGFAVCAVNYTGSTGFGREYRERLSGYWGLVDVFDTVSAVNFLVDRNLIDEKRVGIYGGSAGGYLTLRALQMYPDVWAAGISSYGISDVKALQADSYKFESQDVDRIMLSKTKPEDRERVLVERSPCHFANDVKAPLLLLQGEIDMVVPVAQAQMMASAMHAKGRVAEVVVFPNEGHGWVGENTIHQSFIRKEDWWKRYLTERM